MVGQDLHAADDVAPAVADRDDPRPVGTDHHLALPAAWQFLVVDIARVDEEAFLARPLDEIGVVGLVDEAVVDLAHEFRALAEPRDAPCAGVRCGGLSRRVMEPTCTGSVRASRLRRGVAFRQPHGLGRRGLVPHRARSPGFRRAAARPAPSFPWRCRRTGRRFRDDASRLRARCAASSALPRRYAGASGWALRCSGGFAFLAPFHAFLGDRWCLGLGVALPGGFALLAPLHAFLGDCWRLGFGVALSGGLALLAPLHAFLGDCWRLGLGVALPGGLALLAPLHAFLGDCRRLGLGVARSGGLPLLAPLHLLLSRSLPLGSLALAPAFPPGAPACVRPPFSSCAAVPPLRATGLAWARMMGAASGWASRENAGSGAGANVRPTAAPTRIRKWRFIWTMIP